MTAIWREIGIFEITKHRLPDRTRLFRTNAWLTEAELKELRRVLLGAEKKTEEKMQHENDLREV